jgi:hypothetical protein
MAKTKKMAFGGMGSRPSPMRKVPVGGRYADTMSSLAKPQAAMGSMGVPAMNQMAMRQAPMQSMGALGGNQAPAGASLMQAYKNQGQGSGIQSMDPNIAKAMQSYQGQAGQPSAPPAFKGLSGMGAGMKKGGKVKANAYAKGGTVSSASKRADGCAQRGKTKGRMV